MGYRAWSMAQRPIEAASGWSAGGASRNPSPVALLARLDSTAGARATDLGGPLKDVLLQFIAVAEEIGTRARLVHAESEIARDHYLPVLPDFLPYPSDRFTWSSRCHFDRWFALVAVADFAGDLDALRSALEERLCSLHGRSDIEAKLSHLADLRHRMSKAGVDASTLAAHEPADKATYAKARRKVLTQALDGRAVTEAMQRTPRVQLVERARYGHWPTGPGCIARA